MAAARMGSTTNNPSPLMELMQQLLQGIGAEPAALGGTKQRSPAMNLTVFTFRPFAQIVIQGRPYRLIGQIHHPRFPALCLGGTQAAFLAQLSCFVEYVTDRQRRHFLGP